jgi:hypothetical protein
MEQHCLCSYKSSGSGKERGYRIGHETQEMPYVRAGCKPPREPSRRLATGRCRKKRVSG